MKKTLIALSILVVALSCNNEPTLPIVPHIEFNSVEFIKGDASKPDELVLQIDFTDGDGDLGLTANQTDAPYNQSEYFYDSRGKLLTIRSRNDPAFSYLPAYEKPYDCLNYTDPKQTIYFPASVVDNTFNIVDTQIRNGVTYYGVNDMIYFENNPNHYNIKVDFLVKNSSGTFDEFDWRKEFCNQSFDGRFPPMRDDDKALDGTLKYTMTSIGLTNLFSIKMIKLRVTIKDRALHESNTIESQPFTLQ